MLQLEQNERIIMLERLRFVDDEPFSISKDFVPEKLVPGLLKKSFKEASFYQEPENAHNFEMSEAIEEVEATISTKSQAKLLNIHYPCSATGALHQA